MTTTRALARRRRRRRHQDRRPRRRPRPARPSAATSPRPGPTPRSAGGPTIDRRRRRGRPRAAPARPPTTSRAIGVGVPGRVDPLTGAVTLAVNLGWHDLPLGPRARGPLRPPGVVENDVRAAALGLHARRVVGDDRRPRLPRGRDRDLGRRRARRPAPSRGPRPRRRDRPRRPGARRRPSAPAACTAASRRSSSGPGIARASADAPAVDAARRDDDRSRRRRPPRPRSTSTAPPPPATPSPRRSPTPSAAALAWAVHLLVMTYDVERVVLGGGVTPCRRDRSCAPSGASWTGCALRRRSRGSSSPTDVVELLPPGADAGAWGAVIIAGAAQCLGPVVRHRSRYGRRWATSVIRDGPTARRRSHR